MDVLNAYRKMFASTTNEEVCWWYCGSIASGVEGIGEAPIGQAETIMIYRTETPTPDSLRIIWREIGYFRDPATGEMTKNWFNPLTGKTEDCPKSFEEGPAEFNVRRKGDGVEILLEQKDARIERVQLLSSVTNGQVSLIQHEDKTRAGRLPDGTITGIDSPEANQVRTTLAIYGSLNDVNDPKKTNVRAQGFYSSKQTAKSLSHKDPLNLWSRAFVTGVMVKTAPDEILNPIAWSRMKALFPHFFKGDRVSPNW